MVCCARIRDLLNGWAREFVVACVVLTPFAPTVVPVRAADDAATATSAAPMETITNPDQVWSMTTAQRSQAHPMRIEARIDYVDPAWKLLWLESNGVGYFIPLSSSAPLLRTGQRVLIEGKYVPVVGLNADSVKVTVLQEFMPVEPLRTAGRLGEIQAFDRRVVTTDGYVDQQQLIDDQHLRLSLVVENRPVICWVPPDDPHAVPNWQGSFLRVQAVYSGRIDPTKTQATVELWVGRQRDVQALGPIANDPHFEIPVTPINRLNETAPDTQVRVRGRLQRRETGAYIVIRDETGEVTVYSLQKERIPRGSEVEAVGRTAIAGARWVVQSALFRRAPTTVAPAVAIDSQNLPLKTVDQIRQLPPEEAARGHPVAISGVVTWSMPQADFFFLQDVTGGIRVRYSRERMKNPELQKYLAVDGVTYNGGVTPAVELQSVHDLGSMSHPQPKRITFDQAITGSEDGQWVELRGFIQRTESEGDWRWIYVTTPSGEFVGHLQSPVNFVATPGSLILVHGVCEAISGGKGRITGVMLRVPFLHDITVEEDAPADLFDLPPRPVNSLPQLSTLQEMTRVRVTAVVLHHVPGRYLAVQEGAAGLLVLSRSTELLSPGDTVEAVGILGREGARTILREAVYRRIDTGQSLKPVLLADPAQLSTALDWRLVHVRGMLIDSFHRPERTRLTLQNGSTIFEATLEHPAGVPPPDKFALGTGLDLTGLYKIEFDDARQPRVFQLELRSPRDIAVFQGARLWTAERALAAAGILGLCAALVILWVVALRRQVRQQTEQIRQQLERQAHLEAELERTQRLHSLGLLAGGIAHDFNNLLTVIMGNLTLAMLDEQAMARVGEYLQEAEKGSARARELTQQLVTFARGGEPRREALDLSTLVSKIASLALSGAKSRADFRHPPDLWPVHADADQLGRALQNLVIHARVAMPEGGIISLTAVNEVIDDHTPRPLAPGRYVRLTIEDHGAGIPADKLPGLFDPYAAKYGEDRFGLAITYSILKRHGGHVIVNSTLGRGTIFQLWIPAARAATAPLSAAAAPATGLMNLAGAKILLMDDEETIRRLGENLLQRMNCQPALAANGEECVRLYRAAMESGQPFDLVILDLTIPGGMGGRETIAELRKLDPCVCAIVSSGYSNDPVLANYRDYGFQAVVPKPYDITVLAGAIRRVLGSTP